MSKKEQLPANAVQSEAYVKDFFDMVVPSTIKFNIDHFVCGDSFRCVWAIREYPPSTTDQAILARFGDKEAVTLHMYTRYVDGAEQNKIVQNAGRKNKMMASSNDIEEMVMGEGNLVDVMELLGELRKNREPLLHCAVFIELSANSLDKLKELQSDVAMELTREKISVDRLTMRQQGGFIACMPCGYNVFGTQFERVLPASAVANCYPFNYSGKTDPNGFYIGKDKFGTNIIVDFDRRADDKTNSNILILGNSGQGKSYLLKLLLCNIRMSGKSVICLDAEQEYEDLCNNLGGCYVDLMSGEYIINPLEPKEWSGNTADVDEDAPEAFRRATRLSRHISYLKDFFRVYKNFNEAQIDALEILLSQLYEKYGINDNTDYDRLKPTDYPTMEDLYEIVKCEYQKYEKGSHSLFTEKLLRELCLGLNSMCVGAESKFFNGHTNISDDRFLVFGVKGLMEANKKLKDAMLFNILSYMNHKLLTKGHTAASIDELYLFLTNRTAIEYIRNAMKRVRKKESSIILASQNIEDFLLPEVKELTKPLFSIPTHQFLFNAGNINPREFMDALQLEQSEYELIKYPERGTCLFKCGNERYLLQVIAPEYKAKLFGNAGGR
ncbi:MAG: VirB4 family type IV secretion system protein [Clostridia bacterium]|nr:VirB4 family type IV secretion system protein [Clostridia bacterium]